MTANEVGGDGAKAMCEILKVNTTLKTLYLYGEEEEKGLKEEK